MAQTACEVFEALGQAMDARVPLWFGLTNEPRRATAAPDGSLVVSKEILSWNELPDPVPYERPAAPYERPDPRLVADVKASRIGFNHRDRARVRYQQLVQDRSPCEGIECLKKVDEPRAERHVQTREEFQAWLEAERAAIAARRKA